MKITKNLLGQLVSRPRFQPRTSKIRSKSTDHSTITFSHVSSSTCLWMWLCYEETHGQSPFMMKSNFYWMNFIIMLYCVILLYYIMLTQLWHSAFSMNCIYKFNKVIHSTSTWMIWHSKQWLTHPENSICMARRPDSTCHKTVKLREVALWHGFSPVEETFNTCQPIAQSFEVVPVERERCCLLR
jgi:hypothetical protein